VRNSRGKKQYDSASFFPCSGGGGDLVRGTAKSETGMSSRHSTIPYYTIKAKIAWAANDGLLEGIGSFVRVGGGSQARDPGFDKMGDEEKICGKKLPQNGCLSQ
jgi:hypothetical protein